MLEVNNLTKKFKRKIVLSNINLKLKFGNVYGFVGTNGSGKSVFFKTLCGFLRADNGDIVLKGKKIGKDIDFLTDLGVLIEKPAFIENYNQFQNLKYLAGIKNKISDNDIKKILQKVGLNLSNKDKVKNFSLGMRQRLGIAQAIMEEQKILVLDEPFNGLDRQGREDIKKIIYNLKTPDRLILLTSHIEGDIEDLSDYIFEFNAGSIVPAK